MKKIIAVLLAGATAVLCLGGCGSTATGSSSEKQDSSEKNQLVSYQAVDYKASDYVTLGSYGSFRVKLVDNYNVTANDVKKEIESEIAKLPNYTYLNKKTVSKGDIVNIDISFAINGVQQTDASVSGLNMQLGDNYMQINGFDDKFIGAKVGKTLKFSLSFPADYAVSDYAGKKADFSINVNGIMKKTNMTYAGLTDAYVAKNFEYDTVAAYKKAVRASLQSSMDAKKKSAIEAAVWTQLLKRSKIKSTPSGLQEQRLAEYKNYYIMKANKAGKTLDSYLADNNLTEAEWNKQLESYVPEMIKKELIYMAIADEEGISSDETNYKQYINGMLSTEGFSSASAMYKYLPEDYCRLLYCEQTVLDLLVANTKVTAES